MKHVNWTLLAHLCSAGVRPTVREEGKYTEPIVEPELVNQGLLRARSWKKTKKNTLKLIRTTLYDQKYLATPVKSGDTVTVWDQPHIFSDGKSLCFRKLKHLVHCCDSRFGGWSFSILT